MRWRYGELANGGAAMGGGGETLCLVVPVFNEEERVSETLDRLIDFVSGWPDGSCLLFVDDGSTDRTVAVIEGRLERGGGERVAVVRLPHAGKGAALRSGLRLATTDLAAFCDVDLATPLGELHRLVSVAGAERCLAIGSRGARGSSIGHHEKRLREVAGRSFNRLVQLTLCRGISDTQCGAKAAPTAVWTAVLELSREDGFAWDVEVIAAARRLALPVREVGVEWNHDDRTRVHVLRDGLAMVLAVPRIAWSLHKASLTGSRRLDGRRIGGGRVPGSRPLEPSTRPVNGKVGTALSWRPPERV